MSDKHLVWMIPQSISKYRDCESSCLLFNEPVTKEQAIMSVEDVSIFPKTSFKNLFETIDVGPEEEMSILQSIRSTFE